MTFFSFRTVSGSSLVNQRVKDLALQLLWLWLLLWNFYMLQNALPPKNKTISNMVLIQYLKFLPMIAINLFVTHSPTI